MQLKILIPWILVVGSGLIIAPKYLNENIDLFPTLLKVGDKQTAKVYQSRGCEVVNISDGDTIACKDGTRVRFCGIDSPELAQPLGQESKQRLVNLLQGKEVFISPVETDRYGRTVAEVFVKISQQEELFVNAEMVRSGMAFHYARYSNSCAGRSQIVDAENEARAKAIGVWNGIHEKPWDYRKNKK